MVDLFGMGYTEYDRKVLDKFYQEYVRNASEKDGIHTVRWNKFKNRFITRYPHLYRGSGYGNAKINIGRMKSSLRGVMISLKENMKNLNGELSEALGSDVQFSNSEELFVSYSNEVFTVTHENGETKLSMLPTNIDSDIMTHMADAQKAAKIINSFVGNVAVYKEDDFKRSICFSHLLEKITFGETYSFSEYDTPNRSEVFVVRKRLPFGTHTFSLSDDFKVTLDGNVVEDVRHVLNAIANSNGLCQS